MLIRILCTSYLSYITHAILLFLSSFSALCVCRKKSELAKLEMCVSADVTQEEIRFFVRVD